MQISEISNIRYAPLSEYPDGGYLFDFRGQVCRIAEKIAYLCCLIMKHQHDGLRKITNFCYVLFPKLRNNI